MDKSSPLPTSTSSITQEIKQGPLDKTEKKPKKNMISLLDIDSDTTDEDFEDDDMKVCVHCRRCFVSNTDLIPHCVNVHFCDPSCFNNCRSSQYEKHHLLKSYRSLGLTVRALGKHLKLKKCKECNKIFVCHFDLMVHSEQVHMVSTPYPCICCEKKFETTWKRFQHAKKAHGEKNIKCMFCGKRLNSVYGIENHTLICTHPKPYSSGQHKRNYRLRSSSEKGVSKGEKVKRKRVDESEEEIIIKAEPDMNNKNEESVSIKVE